MVQKRSGRGSVGRCFRELERRETDDDFVMKQRGYGRAYYLKHKKRNKEYQRKYTQKLSEFKNKRCLVCEKLLNYRTKTNVCRKHLNFSSRRKKCFYCGEIIENAWQHQKYHKDCARLVINRTARERYSRLNEENNGN